MWTAYRIAASGMEAQQRALDVAANNLANVQTAGFKARRAELADARAPSEVVGQTEPAGVSVAGVLLSVADGPIQPTGRALDVAIAGPGFFQLSLPDGRTAYTRDGALRVDTQGRLVGSSGAPLAPEVTIPPGTRGVLITRDGRILAEVAGEGQRELGRFALARFANPDGLLAIGDNLLLATEQSGPPAVGAPGGGGFGELAPGSLEASNVDPATELVRVIQAQRAYQVSARALRTVDEMMQEANNLR